MVHSKFGPFWVFSLRRCSFFFRHPHRVSPKRHFFSPSTLGVPQKTCVEFAALEPSPRGPNVGRVPRGASRASRRPEASNGPAASREFSRLPLGHAKQAVFALAAENESAAEGCVRLFGTGGSRGKISGGVGVLFFFGGVSPVITREIVLFASQTLGFGFSRVS